jgi:cation transport ATPase
MRKIRQDLFWAFGYRSAAIPVAAAGRLNRSSLLPQRRCRARR